MDQNENNFQSPSENLEEEQNNEMEGEQPQMDDLNQFLNNDNENMPDNLEDYQGEEEYQNPADLGEEEQMNYGDDMEHLEVEQNPADLGAADNPEEQMYGDIGDEQIDMLNNPEIEGQEMEQLNEDYNEQIGEGENDINDMNDLNVDPNVDNMDMNDMNNLDENNVDLNNAQDIIDMNYLQDMFN